MTLISKLTRLSNFRFGRPFKLATGWWVTDNVIAYIFAFLIGVYRLARWLLYPVLRLIALRLLGWINNLTQMWVLVLLMLLMTLGSQLRPGSVTDQVAHVLWTEARGESQIGQEAVVWSIENRRRANMSYWGGNTYTGVINDRRGEDGQLCEYDGVCFTPDMSHVRYTAAWFEVWNVALTTLINIQFGQTDPTCGMHSYATPEAAEGDAYHESLLSVQMIGSHRFGVDPDVVRRRGLTCSPRPHPRPELHQHSVIDEAVLAALDG